MSEKKLNKRMNLDVARRGDGLFTSAAEKRKRAGEDLDTADWHAKQAAYEEQRIAELERKLGK